MNKEDLVSYKKKIAELSDKEKKLRDLELRKYATGELQGPPVGYASIDKPWLGNYPEMVFHINNDSKRVIDSLKDVWSDNENILDYYGTQITTKELFDKVNLVVKSLDAAGIKKGDSILTSLESVPEFIELFLACEILGCAIKNCIGTKEEIVNLINLDSSIKLYFCPDYIEKSFVEYVDKNTNINGIVSVNPLYSTKRELVRDKILEEIDSRYSEDSMCNNDKYLTWKDFLIKGKNNINDIIENDDNTVRLFSAFTSGSTGIPKEVMHSSQSVLGIIDQMALFPNKSENKHKWLLTILPPTLVATVVAMTFQPLISGKKVILDPYCRVEDLDLEMMHYEPNDWPLIPLFFNSLVGSKRIPDDYDMSYFEMIGFGAEPVTSKFVKDTHQFLTKHKCKAPITSGYGQSEGGSDFTIAMGEELISAGCSGLPLIKTVISVFKPGTDEECVYNEIGEICKSGPGIMLGYYGDDTLTEKVIKIHDDGTVWLHTGDFGYMNNYGLLYTLGRDIIRIYPDKEVFGLNVENKVCNIPGVREAIVVIGKDLDNQGYNNIHLFVVPESKEITSELGENLYAYLQEKLLPEEMPQTVNIISKKPIYKFKTDRKLLKKKYHIQ